VTGCPTHIIREEKLQEELILIQDYQENEFKKKRYNKYCNISLKNDLMVFLKQMGRFRNTQYLEEVVVHP